MAQDEIFLSSHFRWVDRRARRSVRLPRRLRVLAADDVHDQAERESARSGSPTTAPTARRRSSTTSSTSRLSSRSTSARSARRSPAASIRCRSSRSATQDLKEQSLDAFEIGYTGIVGEPRDVSAAFYVNRTKNDIFFTELTDAALHRHQPAAGWPLPPAVIALVPGASFPARFTYLNFGRSRRKGIELGIDSSLNRYVNLFANYSWQGEPEPDGLRHQRAEPAAENRFNIGAGFNYEPRPRQPLGDYTAMRSGRTCSTRAFTARPSLHARQRRLRPEWPATSSRRR